MSTIAIPNLYPAGSTFFTDEESFLNELSNDEANLALGGLRYYSCFCTTLTTILIISVPLTRPYPAPTPPVII